jgi:hypothetical protein
MNNDLIKRLRCGCVVDGDGILERATDKLLDDAADALEAQAERIAELEGGAPDHDLVYDLGKQEFIFLTVEMRARYESLVERVAAEMVRLRTIEASSEKRIAELEDAARSGLQYVGASEAALDEAVARAEKAEADLGNLLAIMLGDGGHYQQECGAEAAIRSATELWSAWVVRAVKAEADLAAARDCIRDLAGPLTDFVGDFRHIDAIAAARGEQSAREWKGDTKTWVDLGEQSKSDVCPTCGNSRVDPGGLPVCRDCGTSKKGKTND